LTSNGQKRVLIAPLDWGLGHTTRCLPLMGYLQQRGHAVLFAGNDWQRAFVKRTLPDLEMTPLEGYNIRYSKHRSTFLLSLLRQTPRILLTIKKENAWLQDLVSKEKIDGIISDNRYGLYHPTVPSVIMTHQLQVLTGMGSTADRLVQKLHYKLLRRFSECWVVDVEDAENLGGKLSHPKTLPGVVKYLGLLSQFEAGTDGAQDGSLLILLSGPEPQRSILSDQLWRAVKDYKGKVVFVEGSNDAHRRDVPEQVQYFGRLTKDELDPLLQKADMVVCRSGYSTVMDLVRLRKKALLIPTPGQTEQEYLARYLHQKGMFFHFDDKPSELNKALAQAKQFPFLQHRNSNHFNQYSNVLDEWLTDL